MSERDELAELIGYTYNNEFQDPAGRSAEAVLKAGYRKIEAVLALIEDAESRRGSLSSMYCKVTTHELRKALGLRDE